MSAIIGHRTELGRALAVLTAAVALAAAPANANAAITLPIEVIGANGLVATTQVSLTPGQAANATTLWLQVHRPAYRDAAVNPARGPKASVQVNGGPWVGLTSSTASCQGNERDMLCLDGGYATLRLSIPLALFGNALRAGPNTIGFRFNGTDGVTSGFRVIGLNVLDATGAYLLPGNAFRYDNPMRWQSPLPGAADIAAGLALWQGASLLQAPGSTVTLSARCATCHAADGRDLKYFNYSNPVIVARAMFHGLSRQQGLQIASYIRSVPLNLPTGMTVADLGRPWNPPYQPGPTIDRRPAIAWSAGAGLGAVLEADSQMQAAMFPRGLTATSKMAVNPRTAPIALQLHDWNDWLPDVAPQDVWGPSFAQGQFPARYADLIASLTNDPTSEITGRYNAGRPWPAYSTFLATVTQAPIDSDHLPGVDIEAARRSLSRWAAIKQWEINQRFGLETAAPLAYGNAGAKLAWPTDYRNIFQAAPHFAAANTGNFVFESPAQGGYDSTVWYTAQFIINPGSNSLYWSLAPVDWNYHPGFIAGLRVFNFGPAQPFRYAQTIGKMIDLYASQPFPNQVGFPQMNVGQWSPGGAGATLSFNTLDLATRGNLYNSMLTRLLDFLTSHPISTIPRNTGLEPATYVPSFVTGLPMEAAAHNGQWANCWYSSIPLFRAAGVPEPTLQRMIAWGKAMWPLGNWAAVQ